MLRPGIVDKNADEIFEIKPITHINEKFFKADNKQVNNYLEALGTKIPFPAYSLGDSSKFVPYNKGGVRAGSFKNKAGDLYSVDLYTNQGRKGFIFYSLKLESIRGDILRDSIKAA